LSLPPWIASGLGGSQVANDTGENRSSGPEVAAESCFWTSKDPIGLRGGLNLYEYVNSDPVNFVDADGLMRDPALPLPLGPLLCMKYSPAGSKARQYCCKKTCEEAFEGWGQAVLDCRAACDRPPPDEEKCPVK
jgi:hypothetical protein